jgi:stage II sporulation protein Q
MDDKNNQSKKQVNKQEEAPEYTTGATTAKSSSWKRLLAKKWVYPAAYIAAVAIILSLMWAYQGSDTNVLEDEDMNLSVTNQDQFPGEEVLDPDAVPVTAATEPMHWPVEDFSQIEVLMPFFDSEASNEAKQAATIQYGDTFIPSVGISLSKQDNETFNVIAALGGTVSLVEKHPIVGHQIEITHNDGLKTIYQSLADVVVIEGDQVIQGEVIAQAGRNELEKSLGVHLHFEVHQDGVPVNPETFIAES